MKQDKKEEIKLAFIAQIEALKTKRNLLEDIEARGNELALYQDDNEELQRIDPSIISAPTAKKNVQSMIRAIVVAEQAAVLAEIDSSPAGSFKYFDASKLSAADKKAFRKMYKTAIVANIKASKDDITSITGISFD